LCYGGGKLLIGWQSELNDKVFIVLELRLPMTLQKFLNFILSTTTMPIITTASKKAGGPQYLSLNLQKIWILI
jgi:hypothetical protein